MADTLAALAYEEALRGLTEQRGRVDNLRTRAATLLSAASIVTSFLGAEALKDTRTGATGAAEADRTLEFWEILAIASFVGVGALCLAILAPKTKGWTFRISGRALLSDYADLVKSSLEPVQQALAGHIEDAYEANERKLGPLFRCFQGGAVLLALEVVFWLLDLTT